MIIQLHTRHTQTQNLDVLELTWIPQILFAIARGTSNLNALNQRPFLPSLCILKTRAALAKRGDNLS